MIWFRPTTGKGYVIYTVTVERLEETTADIFNPKLLTTTFEQLLQLTINYHQLLSSTTINYYITIINYHQLSSQLSKRYLVGCSTGRQHGKGATAIARTVRSFVTLLWHAATCHYYRYFTFDLFSPLRFYWTHYFTFTLLCVVLSFFYFYWTLLFYINTIILHLIFFSPLPLYWTLLFYIHTIILHLIFVTITFTEHIILH